MGPVEIIVLLVLAVLGAFVAVKLIRRRVESRAVEEAAQQVFPVWALQGPFDSGDQSAAAMRNAYLAVFGEEHKKYTPDTFAGHKASFDADPETWEETRRLAVQKASADAHTLAKEIEVMEDMNELFGEAGGHRFELTNVDGNTRLLSKQVLSDEEIEEQDRKSGEAIILGLGNSLLNDPSDEAQRLAEFLGDVHLVHTGEEADASAIGRTWFALTEEKNENPGWETAQEFERLHAAYDATHPDPEEE